MRTDDSRSYSFRCIDLGFDPRLHGDLVLLLPKDIQYAEFEGGSAAGTPEEIAVRMRLAGYRVEVRLPEYGAYDGD